MTTVPPISRVRFAGAPFDPVTVEQTVRILAERAADQPLAVYVTPNIEFLYLRRKHADMAALFEDALLSTNDSRIIHRLALLGGLELEFAPGAYVVDALFHQAIGKDDPICILGATPAIADSLRQTFGLTRLYQHIPPMGFIRDEAAVRAAIDFVAEHPSRFVMVAMGPPQSENLCRRMMVDGRATGIGLCIGSSLQVLTGEIDRAPDWMERSGLVWLYRLQREPGRLWRRYLVHGLQGVMLCLGDALALRLGLRRAHA